MHKSLNLCGKFPFTTPYFFGLTICCNTHDNDYELLKQKCLCEFEAEGKHSGHLPYFIMVKDYWFEVQQADEHFYRCMRCYLKEVPRIKRIVLTPFAFKFERIVRAIGFEVWKHGVIAEWESRNES